MQLHSRNAEGDFLRINITKKKMFDVEKNCEYEIYSSEVFTNSKKKLAARAKKSQSEFKSLKTQIWKRKE